VAAWKVPALALAGLALVSATAAAGGHAGPGPGRPLTGAVPVSAPGPAPGPVAPSDPVRAPAAGGGPTGGTRAPRIDAGWLARTARAAGLPPAALRAYARAELDAPVGCALGWPTLAGIGWVESQHGTLEGRTLHADGTSSTPILGPALDGRGDVAAIPATDSGSTLHGDATWEHAVGPLQFLPSSWATWARDGDGDGLRDPQDLDDAAAAAAAYLCADGRSLTGSGWSAGVLSYNHDAGYVGQVFAAAQAYAERTR
jgi:membrane-bound lytic murein transglycosylase B